MKTQEKAITLIALVVTIVVLLILAAISITLVFGDYGIIQMAQRAADATNKATQKEQEDLENMTGWLQNYIGGGNTSDDLESSDSYILTATYNETYKQIIGKEINNNCFFVVNNDTQRQFRRYINLNVSTKISSDGVTITEWEPFNENSTTGVLCDETGKEILGYISNQDEIHQDVVNQINITSEVEGKQRVGTRINEDGVIIAIFNDNTERLVGQIAVANFNCPLALTKVSENLYAMNSATGEFNGMGDRISQMGGILKRISQNRANQINEEFLQLKEQPYNITINHTDEEHYFVLKNLNQDIIFTPKTLNVYTYADCDAETGAAKMIVPFYEEFFDTDYLCDEDKNKIMVYLINPDTGKMEKDLQPFPPSYVQTLVEEKDGAYMLVKVSIKSDGRIYGIYENGKEVPVAQIAISNSNVNVQLSEETPNLTISKQ